MKFRTSMICVVLLAFGLQLFGQQADSASRAMLYQRLRRAGFPPGVMAGPYKPGLGGAQTQQPSNDRGSHHDSSTYITFVVPGSVCEARFPRCTTPVAINPQGAVTGYYADANAALHGFVRASDGAITTFDGPGATCPYYFGLCTGPVGINPAGAVTGFFCDAITCHGFLRAPDGTITAFDPPGSDFTAGTSGGINPAGAITGTYYDAVTFLAHGFLRARDGTFSTFDAPGADNGTSPSAINPAGAIAGTYYDVNYSGHGFLRDRDGTITTFDPPGSLYTEATAIDPVGAITGYYCDAIGCHGFLRARDGMFTTFDGPGSTQTYPSSINPQGTIAGHYADATGFHGFLRAESGNLTTFDPTGSNTTVSYTFANGINPAGVITGWYIDPAFLGYGFLRIPHCQGKGRDKDCEGGE